MHDIKAIRDNPAAFDAGLKRRGLASRWPEQIGAGRCRWRAVSTAMQEGLARRNEGEQADRRGHGQGRQGHRRGAEGRGRRAQGEAAELEADEKALADAIQLRLDAIPNLPAADVPEGADETEQCRAASLGQARDFNFEPQDHADFGPSLGLDFEAAAAMLGRALRCAARAGRTPPPRARPVHAGHPDRAERL